MRKIPLLLVIFAFPLVSVFAQNPLQEALKRMEAHQKSLASLRADITISKFTVQTGETYKKEGVVKFASYAFRIDSTKPEVENFLVINNEYLLYQPNPSRAFLPNVKVAYTGNISDSQKNTFLIFSILSKKILKENFTIKYLGPDKVGDATPAWHLEFTPKTANTYKTFELWINANGMPIQSKVIENNGDWTDVLFVNMQKNIPIPATDFKIELPKGTKLTKN